MRSVLHSHAHMTRPSFCSFFQPPLWHLCAFSPRHERLFVKKGRSYLAESDIAPPTVSLVMNQVGRETGLGGQLLCIDRRRRADAAPRANP